MDRYLLERIPSFMHELGQIKTAGIFDRIGRGFRDWLVAGRSAAPAVEQALQSRGVVGNLKDKALQATGLMGLGAAGGAYGLHKIEQSRNPSEYDIQQQRLEMMKRMGNTQ